MEYSIETTVYLFAGNIEMPVKIYGNIVPGQEAEKDSQGLPTECATAPEVYTTLVVVAGNQIVTDKDEKRAAEMFGFTVAEFNERLEEELLEAFENEDDDFDYSDDAIF